MPQTTPKILFWDIETSLITGKAFKIWDTNILDISEDWYLLSFSWRWGDEKTTFVKALCDYKGYKSGKDKEVNLVKDLWKLLDKADILVHHNGDKFDLKKARAKFLEFGLPPHSPVRTIDTLKEARKQFGFTSNKLNDLGAKLGVGKKTPHTGLRLWLECMDGIESAWKLMKKYSLQDTKLLYEVYMKMVPWMTSAHLGNFVDGKKPVCPNCGGTHFHKRGTTKTNSGLYQRYHCQGCGAYPRARKKIKGSGNPLTH
jgi:DNA polymerase elongation subunit (family B)